MKNQQILVVYIPRQNISNDIIFDYHEKIVEELEKINCEYFYGEMSLTQGEGYREIGFEITDISEDKIANIVKEFSKSYNIDVQYSIHPVI